MAQFTHTPGYDVPSPEQLTKAAKPNGKTPEKPFDRWQRRVDKGLIDPRERFVRLSFSAEIEEACDAWVESQDLSQWHAVELQLCEEGLGVSLRKRDDSWCCSLTNYERQAEDRDYLLTSFGPDGPRAMFAALFKHRELLAGDWDKAAEFKPPRRKYR